MIATADDGHQTRTGAPRYLWRAIVHPYAAVVLCGILIIVPYFFDASLTFLFKPFVRFASISEHLLISSSLIGTMALGVACGLWLSRTVPRSEIARRVRFYRSDMALLLFGGLLAVALLMSVVKIGSGFSSLGTSVYAARASVRDLGGTAVLGNLFTIALPATLLLLQLRGVRIGIIAIGAFGLIAMSGFAISERLTILEGLICLIVFIGLFQPHVIRVRTVAIMGVLCALLFGANLVMRTLPMLPPALQDKVITLLPEIVASTLGSYYSDPVNKLYYQMLVPYRAGSLGDEQFFMAAPRQIIGRLTGEPVGIKQGHVKYSAGSGTFTDLDSLGGRDIKLTNPGGPSQDFSDFGWWIYAIVFLKFLVFARIYRAAAGLHPLAVAVYPLFAIAAWDYPRLNYLYEVRGVIPLLLALMFIPLAMYLEGIQARKSGPQAHAAPAPAA